MNLNETIYNKNHNMGVEELGPETREVTFDNLQVKYIGEMILKKIQCHLVVETGVKMMRYFIVVFSCGVN